MAYGLKKQELDKILTQHFLGHSVSRATATLPQSTVGNLFTVSTGRVLLTGIIGEVTTVIQTQANNTKIVFDPTVTGANVDLCAILDITADAIGTLYSITGTVANAMLSGFAVQAQLTPIVLQPGAIALSCSASSTGSVKWDMWYLPLDTGAMVAAV